jgi:D-aminoacyl-tRNA deacylase
MRLILQRVVEAQVIVSERTVGAIRTGLLVFLGVSKSDTTEDADYLLDKLLFLRIFGDAEGKMNRNIQDAGGELLIVSQFTLYADCRKGRRPSFDLAAPPDRAQSLYEYFVTRARQSPVPVQTGIFQASMEVRLVNDGPVTILLESDARPLTGGSYTSRTT